ncbi:MAG: DUF4296 domain-containing protein [Bacteroidales bacterium]|nr:DUF4296 domain-containing protein [Bacteroidales bacterium]
MRVCRHILRAVLLLVLLGSCSGRPRIIPGDTLASIYADMFLADQWLSDHSSESKKADTSLFYDPIFSRYGYTFEDYDASVKHYLKDPERYSKIFKKASEKLSSGRDLYRKKIEAIELAREVEKSLVGFAEKDFGSDTLLWRTAYKDSLLELSRIRDSLMRDSMSRDSLVRDSLLRDSLARETELKSRPEAIIQLSGEKLKTKR